MEMFEAIEKIRPHVFSISTQDSSGTGWLVSLSKTSALCAVATASHVVNHAHDWELPIRLVHAETGKNILLRSQDRVIVLGDGLDTAAIIFNYSDFKLPSETLTLIKPDYHTKQGVEIGWLGFPAIYRSGLCFFSGRVSNYIKEEKNYLIDGVAINGVSGGPAFQCVSQRFDLIGVVSAYIANRATGETLPGVAVVQDVTQFYGITQGFKTLDEAKSDESPPEDVSRPETRGLSGI